MKTLLLTILIVLHAGFMNVINAQQSHKKKTVAILIYDGVYLLDFCGPLEIFNDAMINDSTAAFEVYLVAPTLAPIKSHTNTTITPQYSIENCPKPDLLVVPGGNLKLATENSSVADWIKSVSTQTEITMSVCTGAFILADLGILDGQKATTWYGATTRLQKKYPKILVQAGQRYTDNGKIVTTAGISAGIDGSLYVVGRLFGKEVARATAKYIEYDYKE